VDAIEKYIGGNGSAPPKAMRETVERISRQGGTPLVVAVGARALGVIYLKDIVKGGMRERFDQLRAMGIRTVMITGDNPLTAAHYLQAPLLNLQMGLHCLITDAVGELTDKQKDILYACREDGERLERLMRDLTDLSRIESGEAAPRLAPVRIEEVIQSAVESFRLAAEAKDQSLKTDIAPRLPQFHADAEQIERVLDNLLSNAIRHTPRGGEIRIAAAQRAEYLAISVVDTGHGIPPEYLPRLFNRFLSVPGAQSGGAGLGLAISKRLIEAHGGQISAQSQVGLGTTITFTLPVAREGATPA
jgi:signal transduction histidine kinase